MWCEVCELECDLLLLECEHPKNAYCAMYQANAKKDIKQFGPKHYKALSDLEIGETFRYKGSDENDWHTVSGKDEAKIYYAGYLPDVPESNYRVENVEVIVK